MLMIATDQPTAKADETGDTVTFTIPSGNGESVVFDLSPHQALRLAHTLNREVAQMMRNQRARDDWQEENVIHFRRTAQV